MITKRISKFIENKRNNLYCSRSAKKLLYDIENNHSDKTLYLFCAPTHSNLGDQAQLMCWLHLFKEWYPEYHIICVPSRFKTLQTIPAIRKKIKKEDLLFIHSGYLIYDPHPELPFIQEIIHAFYDFHITILPQTVNLIEKWVQHVIAECFNGHSNLTLVCRDQVSLEKSKKLFPNVELRLMPDVVTSLIGNKDFIYERKRNGVLLCLRNDGEKFYSDDQLNQLKSKFGNIRVDKCDTTIKAPIWSWTQNRELLIRKMLKKFAEYQVIITDRYHGTILSQIVNTPVVVISSADHKLISGVRWFPEEQFGHNIFFAPNLDDAYSKASEILNRNGKVIQNPAWFKNNYFSKDINK